MSASTHLEHLRALARYNRWFNGRLYDHQTHHRGQATTLLFQLGRDPGLTDLIALWGQPG